MPGFGYSRVHILGTYLVGVDSTEDIAVDYKYTIITIIQSPTDADACVLGLPVVPVTDARSFHCLNLQRALGRCEECGDWQGRRHDSIIAAPYCVMAPKVIGSVTNLLGKMISLGALFLHCHN